MAFDRVGRLRPTWTLAVHHQYDLCSERQVEVALPLTRLTGTHVSSQPALVDHRADTVA